MRGEDSQPNQTLATGFALLKNLGLSDPSIPKEPTDLKIRPIRAGLNPDLDGSPSLPPILKPVGSWRKNGPPLPNPPNTQFLTHQSLFCSSQTLSSFQTSLCQFHENFASDTTKGEFLSLTRQSKTLQERLNLLERQKTDFGNSADSRARILSLLRQIQQKSQAFPEMFAVVIELARNPEILHGIKRDQRTQKDPFNPSRLSLLICESFVKKYDPFDFANLSNFLQLHDWLFEIQAISIGPNLNNVPGRLWTKFLRRCIWPLCHDFLREKSSSKLPIWGKRWFESNLLSIGDGSLFFRDVAKPYLVANLDALCTNGDIHSWIEFSNSTNLSSEFAVIVRQHADLVVRNWNPSTALQLIGRWPFVLGHSGDFLYKTIGPQISKRLSIGDIQSIRPFISILPISLSASLIADSYFPSKITEITVLAERNLLAAANLYLQLESSIPPEILHTRSIVAKLVECLDKLKARNPILRGLKVERDPEPATIQDILESEAAKGQFVCIPRGSIDGKSVFSIGRVTVGISDGIIWIQKGLNWQPVFVNEIVELAS
jgi:hypothetical protein